MESQNSRPPLPSVEELTDRLNALSDVHDDPSPEVKLGILTLNVGGEKISTRLENFPPGSIIHSMLSTKLKCRDGQGNIFLDRDPTTFKRVLNCLRTGRIFSNDYSELISMHLEADYLGLPELKYRIQLQLHFSCHPIGDDLPCDELKDEPKLYLVVVFQNVAFKMVKTDFTCGIYCQKPAPCSAFKLSVAPPHVLAGTNLNKLYAMNPEYSVLTSLGDKVSVMSMVRKSGMPWVQPEFESTSECRFYCTDLRIDFVNYRNIFFLIPKESQVPCISDLLRAEELIMRRWDYYWEQVCYAGGSDTHHLIREVGVNTPGISRPDPTLPLPSMEGVRRPVDEMRAATGRPARDW